MKVLPNGLCVIEGDTHLSKWIEESGDLVIRGDVALQRNLELIKEGDVVVDGGAALGDHTKAYLEKVGPLGEVYAFEPNPEYYQCLVRNCPSALFDNRALWDEDTWLSMDIAPDSNMGASYICDRGKVRIEAIRLDGLALERCDFLKLDIEGSELMALKGATATVSRCQPIIQCEINPPLMELFGYKLADMLAWLARMGYRSELFGTPSQYGAQELLATPL